MLFHHHTITMLRMVVHYHHHQGRILANKYLDHAAQRIFPVKSETQWNLGWIFFIFLIFSDFFPHILRVLLYQTCLNHEYNPLNRFLMPKLHKKMGSFISVWCLVQKLWWLSIFVGNPRWPPRWPLNGPLGTIFQDGNIEIRLLDTMRITKK